MVSAVASAVLSIFPCRTVRGNFRSPRTHPSCLFLCQIVLYVWARRARFPFVPSEETNCFTNSFDPAYCDTYTDCLVVRKHTFLDVLDFCYLGTVLLAFLFCQSLCILPLSRAHTGVHTHPCYLGSALASVVSVVLDLNSILACCGHGFNACQSLAWTEFSVPKSWRQWNCKENAVMVPQLSCLHYKTVTSGFGLAGIVPGRCLGDLSQMRL